MGRRAEQSSRRTYHVLLGGFGRVTDILAPVQPWVRTTAALTKDFSRARRKAAVVSFWRQNLLEVNYNFRHGNSKLECLQLQWYHGEVHNRSLICLESRHQRPLCFFPWSLRISIICFWYRFSLAWFCPSLAWSCSTIALSWIISCRSAQFSEIIPIVLPLFAIVFVRALMCAMQCWEYCCAVDVWASQTLMIPSCRKLILSSDWLAWDRVSLALEQSRSASSPSAYLVSSESSFSAPLLHQLIRSLSWDPIKYVLTS